VRDLLLIAFVVGTVPFILARPYIGILMFAWLSYMNPHREFGYSLANSVPMAAIVGAATLVAMVLSKDTRRLPLWPIMWVWFGWIAWMNISTLFALEPEYARIEWERSMKIQAMALATIMVMQGKERIVQLVWVVALSVGYFGIKGGLFALRTGGQYRVWGPDETFFSGTNPLALALLMVLPLMFFLRGQAQRKWLRWAMLGAIGLTAFAVVSTYSRGAFVTAAAVVLFLATRVRNKLVIAPLLLVAVLGLAAFMPQQYYDRISTIGTYEQDSSAMGRIEAWTVGWRLALDRPLVGGGFQVYSQELFDRYLPGVELHDSHSIYFESLAEQGFVGLGLFVALLAMALRQGRALRKLTRDRPGLEWAYDLASMLQVSLVAYAVGGAFLGLAYFDLYYHLIGMLILVRLEVDRVLKDAVTAPQKARPSPMRPLLTHSRVRRN
jgi:probable O-glycosylation ligase (exosortase A-associated)